MTIASGVQQITTLADQNLQVLNQSPHTHLPLRYLTKIKFAGSGGVVGQGAPTAIVVTLSGLNTSGGSIRTKVGVASYVQWGNGPEFQPFPPDSEGFWLVVQTDTLAIVDFLQVDWVAYWLDHPATGRTGR